MKDKKAELRPEEILSLVKEVTARKKLLQLMPEVAEIIAEYPEAMKKPADIRGQILRRITIELAQDISSENQGSQ